MAQGVADAHPKVRWASCQALGQLSTDLGPDLQASAKSIVVERGREGKVGGGEWPCVARPRQLGVIDNRSPSLTLARCVLITLFTAGGAARQNPARGHGRLIPDPLVLFVPTLL